LTASASSVESTAAQIILLAGAAGPGRRHCGPVWLRVIAVLELVGAVILSSALVTMGRGAGPWLAESCGALAQATGPGDSSVSNQEQLCFFRFMQTFDSSGTAGRGPRELLHRVFGNS